MSEADDRMSADVNHPLRYTKGDIECIDALEAAVVGKSPDEAICVANVIKYLWRYEEKEPLRSLKSARWYLDRLISKVERRTDPWLSRAGRLRDDAGTNGTNGTGGA